MLDRPQTPVFLRYGDAALPSPTVDQVIEVMETILADAEEEGPPELDLYYPFDDTRSCRLAILAAYHRSEPTSWIVHFLPHRIPGPSLLLARDGKNCDRFQRRTCVGVISEYCTACLIDFDATLRTAIDWFLKEHSPCPNLKWIDYDDAVRDADNSID